MFFKDVIGQDEIKQRLIHSVHEERISHAQMFAGPEGTGKLAMAIAYAQFISCKNRSETDSCGTCPSCHKYKKLAHPDLHFAFPVFNSAKVKNAVSDNFLPEWREMIKNTPYFNLSQWLEKIDAGNSQGLIYERESDAIYKKLNLKSFEAEYKVMIIWLPEKMNAACSNKLLKIIEEPPSKTLFLLISEDENLIISTIRSRVQLVKFPFIKNKALTDFLKNQENIQPDIIAESVHLSGGNFLKVQEYLHPDDDKQFYFQKFQEMMRFAYKREVLELIDWADEMAKIGRDKQKLFFNTALRLVREYFVMNLNKSQLNYLNREEKDWGKRFAPFINERNIVSFNEEFELAIKHIAMNGNPRIIFLDTALRMVRLIKV